jgi:hypothetical protein
MNKVIYRNPEYNSKVNTNAVAQHSAVPFPEICIATH